MSKGDQDKPTRFRDEVRKEVSGTANVFANGCLIYMVLMALVVLFIFLY
jgi:hypothetical protein